MTHLEQLPNAPDIIHAFRRLSEHPEISRIPGAFVYQNEVSPDYLHVGGAMFFIQEIAKEHCVGRGVDIGACHWPLPGAIPLDLERGTGAGKSIADFREGELDFVFSSHCLEHIEDWKVELKLWLSKIKPGGKLFLYLPHPSCKMWRKGSPFVEHFHKWVPEPLVIRDELKNQGCKVKFSSEPDLYRSFYVVGTKPLSA